MKKNILIKIILMLMLIFLLYGCGSIKVKTAKRESGTLVKVGYMANYGSLWSITNAIEQGYMHDENIRVELVKYVDGPAIISALNEKEIDVGYIGHGAHKLCIEGNANIFALSHISNADAIVVTSEINSMKDLEGKLVAYVEGTSSEDLLNMALKKADMEITDIVGIRIIPEEIVESMSLTGLDAVSIWSPYSLEILESVEGSKVLVDNLTFADDTIGLGSWITSDDYYEYNKRTLVHFTKALFKAMDYAANDHFEETSKIIAEQLGVDQEDVFEQRGDAKWLTGKEIVSGLEDGTLKGYYELQRDGFIKSGFLLNRYSVEDYILFDVMTEAKNY